MSERNPAAVREKSQQSTNPEKGLTAQQVAERLSKYGPNRLVEEQKIRFLGVLKEELVEPMILLLIAVGVLYSVWGNLTDALTIIAIISILVLVEVWNEYRAKRSIAALKRLASPTSTVLRDGKTIEVSTTEIVPGDILLLKPGQRVPADAVLLEAVGLEVDESALTGESFPVPKEAGVVILESPRVSDRKNMVYSGTVVAKGRAKAFVVATGVHTELGRVAGITKATKEPKTSLQLGMKQLSKTLVWIALFFSILVPALAFLGGLSPEQSILYGFSLAFATIPEELPIIITMVLGVGTYVLSRKNAVVKHLRAAETLGSTTVIVTDKTGTLTENKLRVDSVYFDGRIVKKQEFGQNEKEALKTALLASDGIKNVTVETKLSNPLAEAILEVVKENGADLQKLQAAWILKNEASFDSKSKLASYVYQLGKSTVALTSGAPEKIVANSEKILLGGQEVLMTEEIRQRICGAASEMAQGGQRLLGFGYQRILPTQMEAKYRLEQNLVFVGIIGFTDPPRREVKDALRMCRDAGIRVIMVTGDHPETAKAIATQVGINSSRVLSGEDIANLSDEELKKELRRTQVFARTTPEDKLRIVKLLREEGEIVAVTGDGINDAPALKEAHIGIAMGIRGTDVAKETADMILTDDNFSTIETAVKEGRKIFANLQKGVRYYLACKIALIASFLLPTALGAPLPFAPIQIIILELFMDLAASTAFVAEPQEVDSMKRPPIDPNEKFVNWKMKISIIKGAVSLFAAVSASYLFTYYTTQNLVQSQTVAFATWMFGHIFLALNFRSEKQSLLKQGLLSNKVMILWAVGAAVTLIISTNISALHTLFKITSLSLADWALSIGTAFTATFWIELRKLLQQKGFSKR
ncbi:MAG: cation-transporting P-type ATPase [Candidatus Bathyarchaeota archaeon]|nr:cation-transporting P-type ATPase [Candidatus Bathyarchaeota archaeon]